MGDFGDFEDFQHDVQGRRIKIYKNGEFEDSKVLFVQAHWSWDDFLCAITQRLEMAPKAQRAFNADGAEIDDIMCIEDDDMLFFSSGDAFQAPDLNPGSETERRSAENSHKSGDFTGIIGGYKIGSFLGKGGFGEVRLGVHQLTGEQVALKFIMKSEMGSLGDVERTTTEIQCLTALSHPNVIKLLRVMNEHEHLVLGIELLKGGDLHHYLRDLDRFLSESEARSIFSQIVAGVGYAHNQHICHRDLKLENVLLASKNDTSLVKIADFGLSGFYRPGATVKTNCGSISYLAPEVFRGTSNSGPPLDVWSLGVMLYAIICRKLPFEGSDLTGSHRPRENVIRNRILHCEYAMDSRISEQAKDLLQRMLHLDPAERATIPEIFNHPWLRGNTSLAAGFDSLNASEESTAADEGVVLPRVDTKQEPSASPSAPASAISNSDTKKVVESVLPKHGVGSPKSRSKSGTRTSQGSNISIGKQASHREAILPSEDRTGSHGSGGRARRRITTCNSKDETDTKAPVSPTRKSTAKLPMKPSGSASPKRTRVID